VDTYATNGIICITGNNKFVHGTGRMKDAFAFKREESTGILVSPPKYRFFKTCPVTWKEHRRYAYATATGSNVVDPKEAAIKKDDHTCDAIRYLEATNLGPTFRSESPDEYEFADTQYEVDKTTGY